MTDSRKALIKKKIMRLRYLETHLQDISLVAGRVIREPDLLTIEQTAILSERAKEIRSEKSSYIDLQPADIKTVRFKDFISSLNKANNQNVYISLYYTEHLGSLIIPSIAEVNFVFDYRKIESGYFIVSTTDGVDNLLFDININNEVISIEVCLRGHNWSKVAY